MTDRVKGCWVAFDKDYRTDDAERILEAIAMIRGVMAVESSITDTDDWMNRRMIANDYWDKIREVLK